MSRFNTTFAKLNAKNEGAFVPFVTLCDPNLERSFDIICTLVENGADALELGFPFSDPLLDGPVIQAANQRALSAGYSSDASFELISKVRSKYPDIPIGLLLCANLVYAQTIEDFYKRCSEVGIDAVLIADVPLLASNEFMPFAEKYGIQQVFICPPNADEKTIQRLAIQSKGYVYLVSRAGVTSAENQKMTSNLAELINALKQNNSPPILQGFGISTPQQVTDCLKLGIAGAISGSATVKIIEQYLNDHEKCLEELASFVKRMKESTVLKLR
ncbi:tryptophan synthase subunit alpha [Pasteurella dagmatis]|uniref:Tryptophan synthase alpha chain n=1 Tax=Pasteurella dagmatis ATCC 43325 TaxID=667128 RepID=C9PQZ6_9PAST|nr:tryptophan synthase subunit alpha [Pasteurella dagmatis]EEX49897.1 tryptophan synthase, alpha subunit [Pasteurella dagmatis ATCC 43325]SNV60265.1 tryptophan synthase alpha chain [Pasteurella dagmatis]